MGLDGESGDAGDVRGGHGGTRVDATEASGTDGRRQDRDAGGGHVRAHSRVTAARTRGAEIREFAVVPVGDFVGGQGDLLVVGGDDGFGVGGFHPEQRNVDPPLLTGFGIAGDQALVGWQLVAVVDHDGSRQTPALGVHGAQHTGAVATPGDHDGPARNAGVLIAIAAGRDLVVLGSEDVELRALGKFGAVDVDGLDRLAVDGELCGRVVLHGIVCGDGDHPCAGAWRGRQVGLRTGVARGGDHHDAGGHRVGNGDGIGVGGPAERRTEREVDHVHVVLDGPVDGISGEAAVSLAPENLQRVQIGFGSHAGTDPELVVVGGGVIGTLVSLAVSGHA